MPYQPAGAKAERWPHRRAVVCCTDRMTKRWVGGVIGGGLVAAGVVTGMVGIWGGTAGLFLLGFPLALVGGRIVGWAIGLGTPVRSR